MTPTDVAILLAVTIGLPLIGYVWRRWVTDSQDSGQSSPGPAGGRAGRPVARTWRPLKAGNGPALGNPAGPRHSPARRVGSAQAQPNCAVDSREVP